MPAFTILAASVAIVTVPAPHRAKASELQPICQKSEIRNADTAAAVGIHPLGQEPPARHILAVVRAVDGCSRPVVVRSVVGTPHERAVQPRKLLNTSG